MATTGREFGFAFDPSFRLAGRPFGITPSRCWIVVSDSELLARFGPWRIRTGLTNIRRTQVTGPYHWLKVAGPARLAVTDRGLTFATNAHRGVQLDFHEPIAGIEPTGRLRHPNLTVTPTDWSELIETIEGRT